ncbi:MAG: prolyl oligopeptidase family serine peptidase [Blastocatellia bacterium]
MTASLALVCIFSSITVAQKLTYPQTRKVDHTDNYHGTTVADPYRWLEDDNAAETKDWVEAQNKVTFAYLNAIPERAWIRERLTKLWNYEKFSAPFKRGNRYFYSCNTGLQNQSVLYTTASLADQGKLLLDPNTLSGDGTVALSGMSVSEDAKLLAYGISVSGSDWQEWRVRDVETGKDLPDTLKWVKFSGASWTKDGKGFFYNRYPEPDESKKLQAQNVAQKMYFHRLGTPQSADVVAFERPDQPEWMFDGEVTEDGRYLIISVFKGSSSGNMVFYRDLQNPEAKTSELVSGFDFQNGVIDHLDGTIYLYTTAGAPQGRLVAIDLQKPDKANWKVVIPESRDNLQAVNILNHQIVATYLHDAATQIKIFDRKGKFIRNVELPGIGTASGFGGKRADTEAFYTFTSFTDAGTVYRYDMKTGKSSVFRQAKVAFNPADYETNQVFYASKDGARVPMFIVHKKGLKLDGANPTYLYGYGGFNVSLTPAFSPGLLAWMEMGGIFAQPTLRGGGEYGEKWHKAGTKQKKQNVFDDFIAAAEYLIAGKYTSTPKLAIGGGSNGGLLVGACMTQRPELFGAALPAVGVMDMLRFHKFTIGWAWVSDYGSADNAAEFPALYDYSPYHRLQDGVKYPATMVTTADHDDRVVPAHSFKFAARLQAAHGGETPVLIRIETKAGHGAGKPTSKQIEELADRWGFLVRALKMQLNAPRG